MELEGIRPKYWGSTASKLQVLKVTERVISCTDEVPRTANEIARTVVEIYGGNMETARKRVMFLASVENGPLMESGFRRCKVTACEARTFVLRIHETSDTPSQE